MPHPARPSADEERLALLLETGLLDSPREEIFDRIARIAMHILRAPSALMSLVDRDRQFFKSAEGLGEPLNTTRETPLSWSFCKYVVEADAPLVVADAREHPTLAGNPSVAELGVVAYCGVPLRLGDARPLGTLCVVDRQRREWQPGDVEVLTDLARVMMSEVARRLEVARHVQTGEDLATMAREAEQLFNESPVPQWLCDPGTLEVLEVNEAAIRLYGFSREEFRRRRLTDLRAPGSGEGSRVRHVMKDGRERVMEVARRHINWGKREVLLKVAMDVTDRVAAEDARQRLEGQLRQAHRLEALGLLAGSVAHDFNNALVAALGNVEVVLSEPGGPGDQAALEDAREAIRRASLISRQLLGLARPSADTPVVDEVGLAVERSVPLLRRLLPPGIPLLVERSPEPYPVEIAAAGFDQILLNLVTNARDAIDGTGRIEIVVRRALADLPPSLPPAEYVAVDVLDDGPGIPDDVRARASEPFFTTKSQGTGLGLAIVDGIARQARGALDLGPTPDGGTRASVYLPITSRPLTVAGVEAPPVVRGDGEALLVVDDDPTVRSTVALLLRRGGYTVHEAQSAWDALEVLRVRPEVRLVLTDVRMPVMNGVELLHAARTLYPALPVLLMSGYTRGELDDDVSRVADGFLLKPFEQRDLLRMVGDVLGAAPRPAP